MQVIFPFVYGAAIEQTVDYGNGGHCSLDDLA